MSESTVGQADRNADEEVWSAITALERILEAMPEDAPSLRTIILAYEQVGDHTRAREHVLRLARVLLKKGNAKAAVELLPKLASYVQAGEGDAEAQELVGQVEALKGSLPKSEPRQSAVASGREGAPLKPAPSVSMNFNMAVELSFAWSLMEAEQFSQDEYASVVQDLTEMSAGASKSTISVLHVLESRAPKSLDRIITYASKKYEAPIVALDGFDFRPEVRSMLAPALMTARGALVFELLGRDALVALMNPADPQIRRDVERLTGRQCHFYMALPAEFDAAVARILASLQDEEQSKGDAPDKATR